MAIELFVGLIVAAVIGLALLAAMVAQQTLASPSQHFSSQTMRSQSQ